MLLAFASPPIILLAILGLGLFARTLALLVAQDLFPNNSMSLHHLRLPYALRPCALNRSTWRLKRSSRRQLLLRTCAHNTCTSRAFAPVRTPRSISSSMSSQLSILRATELLVSFRRNHHLHFSRAGGLGDLRGLFTLGQGLPRLFARDLACPVRRCPSGWGDGIKEWRGGGRKVR